MSRGALNWLMTIPADGSLPMNGIAPLLIEWATPTHPAARLQDYGLSLAKLELFHPQPERVSLLLQSLDLQAPVSLGAAPKDSLPRLLAHINTPRGVRLLAGPTFKG